MRHNYISMHSKTKSKSEKANEKSETVDNSLSSSLWPCAKSSPDTDGSSWSRQWMVHSSPFPCCEWKMDSAETGMKPWPIRITNPWGSLIAQIDDCVASVIVDQSPERVDRALLRPLRHDEFSFSSESIHLQHQRIRYQFPVPFPHLDCVNICVIFAFPMQRLKVRSRVVSCNLSVIPLSSRVH